MHRYAKEYYLMHKDIPVCLMEISDDGVLGSVRRNEAAAAQLSDYDGLSYDKHR